VPEEPVRPHESGCLVPVRSHHAPAVGRWAIRNELCPTCILARDGCTKQYTAAFTGYRRRSGDARLDNAADFGGGALDSTPAPVYNR
jgi:hypothetical protein